METKSKKINDNTNNINEKTAWFETKYNINSEIIEADNEYSMISIQLESYNNPYLLQSQTSQLCEKNEIAFVSDVNLFELKLNSDPQYYKYPRNNNKIDFDNKHFNKIIGHCLKCDKFIINSEKKFENDLYCKNCVCQEYNCMFQRNNDSSNSVYCKKHFSFYNHY